MALPTAKSYSTVVAQPEPDDSRLTWNHPALDL